MFKCYKDADIEAFINEKAISFVEKEICQVYLILDEIQFNNNQINIEAYFTLSHRALIFQDDVSKTTRRSITGFKDREVSEFVLIGQLGKYMDTAGKTSDISLDVILNYAFEVIQSSSLLIPCKMALIECSEEIHDKGIYEKCHFKLLQIDGDYYQYYKPL